MSLKTTGVFLIVAAIVLLAFVAYHNSRKRTQPIVFSARDLLDGTWNYSKQVFLDPQSGRTVDHDRNDATTSEGESYTMLRAVWWDDKATFDKAWGFTKNNLQHQSGDHLFSWFYSKLPNGNFGINAANGDNNTAADADSDITLALIFAYDRWQDPQYLQAAQQILPDIWSQEVATIQGKPYLLADNVEKTSDKPNYLLNPSYCAPYAYKIFKKYDPSRDWLGLADTCYRVISQTAASPLDKPSTINLPPDWAAINKTTGAISSSGQNNLTTDYSYDAMRIPFRLTLDLLWFKDPRAQTALQNFGFLAQQWKNNQTIIADYAHDGKVVQQTEAPAGYGTSLGYFMITDDQAAQQIYSQKLQALYNPDTSYWKQQLSYYDDNWTWFGIALYNNYLTNLDAQ